MKDDFISVEHLMLGLLDEQDPCHRELFRAFSDPESTAFCSAYRCAGQPAGDHR